MQFCTRLFSLKICDFDAAHEERARKKVDAKPAVSRPVPGSLLLAWQALRPGGVGSFGTDPKYVFSTFHFSGQKMTDFTLRATAPQRIRVARQCKTCLKGHLMGFITRPCRPHYEHAGNFPKPKCEILIFQKITIFDIPSATTPQPIDAGQFPLAQNSPYSSPT